MLWSVDCSDAIRWLNSQPDDSIDLLISSPPYVEARTYSQNLGKPLDEWVPWMVDVVRAASPKVKGLIALNVEGQTRGYQYLPAPFLLTADLHRAGFNLRKPCVFHRVGIPGGGGKSSQHEANGGSADWLRNDWEPVLCISRPGPLPWADSLACGNAPKCPVGGRMSYRTQDGERVNKRHRSAPGKGNDYVRPATSNPGNVIVERYTAQEVSELLSDGAGEESDVIHCVVGGHLMGHALAHRNEAPMPLTLAEFFVKSFCKPGGVVADPFCGSGTSLEAAVANGRIGRGCDVRESQAELTRRRLRTVCPPLPDTL